jgi:hypothetical protein
MKCRMVLGKAVAVLMVTGLVMGILPSLALAANQALVDKGINMMWDGVDGAKAAVGTIQKGQQMYVQIAREKGFCERCSPGQPEDR